MSSDTVPLGPTLLEPEHFHALAIGAGDEETITALWRGERSWRLLVLRALLDSCVTRLDATGPLASITDAWQLLVRAYAADPDVSEDILAQPQVGIWAAHTLRRLRDDSPQAVPLWMDVGYLHALSAASAVRAGLSFDLDIPARQGAAVLPTVGTASVPPDVPVVRVRSRDGQVDVVAAARTIRRAADDPDWHEPIIVEVDVDGAGLRVELLDRDVYRDLRGPAPPQPLSASQITRWRARLADAWELLVREQRDRALAIAKSLRTLAPLEQRERFRQLSASGAEAFGGILLSEPDDAAQLAVTLVHESQHHKLGALSHLLTLCESDARIRYYVPWRDDPRPLAGALQGAYAFAGITEFWRAHRRHGPSAHRAAADFEFALWRQQTLGAVRAIMASGRLTGHGQRFVATLHAQLETCQEEPVPAAALASARAVAVDHRAMWRGHNIRLDHADRDTLTAAWQRRDPAMEAVRAVDARTVLAQPPAGLLDARAVLRRYLLVDPDAFAGLRAAPQEVGDRVAGATPADLALVAGDLERARVGYLAELRQDPSRVHAWVGLGLTDVDGRAGPATRALLGRPELVLAVVHALAPAYQAIALPDPLELATWVGHGLPDGAVDTSDPAGWQTA
ncbi:HEXXH motif domain-containing protein [Micromonospora sp. WMMD812]|uniref:HEXXH motif domain-containing protein n=1 Tax=Micromonospora sp. WMMD812 TaxID=3015152 RepID=UPI00248B58F3|nr:HEXXH motif domain-containing protein [Micromonospora sp. WMMD812]WBB68301.1 HEXXH motif domain-containing protein [Micromonospora sp. WMMD812]